MQSTTYPTRNRLLSAWTARLLGTAAIFALSSQVSSDSSAIDNPFYDSPQWRLWHLDQQPVRTSSKVLTPLSSAERVFPANPGEDSPGLPFLHYRTGDWSERKLAGIWDDVYVSLDNNHSYLPHQWKDSNGNVAQLRGQSMDFTYRQSDRNLRRFGATFTSQSTTGVGHELVDSAQKIDLLEREFCFANILRAGPAHTSYREPDPDRILDLYDAIVPCFFNSVGSSGSETNAIAKMMIAGGHLPKSTKHKLKENGLYIPTLLYIWKAALPYQVPYDNELRHRVAYASSGLEEDKRIVNLVELNHAYHRYDESRHLKNMVDLASGMKNTPPIALFDSIKVKHGELKSVNKTTIRIHQNSRKTIELRVSAADSFDLHGKPLSYSWKLLYGNTLANIETKSSGREALISIPHSEKLPQGRTVIMLTVNNGIYDSNPAMINIYRSKGKPNNRPSLSGIEDTSVLSGETVRFEISTKDPEKFPVTLYQWAEQVGELKGNSFSWTPLRSSKPRKEKVRIIASDGTGSYNSKQAQITVSPIIAQITADHAQGGAPLTVSFSSDKSRDIDSNTLNYYWDFNDGNTSLERNPRYIFKSPGYYQVKLTVSSPQGEHTATNLIHVEHQWNKTLKNGWRQSGINKKVWRVDGTAHTEVGSFGDSGLSLRLTPKKSTPRDQAIDIISTKAFSSPLYLEASFKRAHAGSETGFEILGSLIGKVGGFDTSIAYLDSDRNTHHTAIVKQLRVPRTASKLSLYVTPDPNNTGKIRYAGYLETDLGREFFSIDAQDEVEDRLVIRTKGGSGPLTISKFVVWAPDGNQ